jgi:hypothetical protein
MPTAAVCDIFETLRLNVITYIETKKQLERQELEYKTLSSRLAALNRGETGFAPSTFSSSSASVGHSASLENGGAPLSALRSNSVSSSTSSVAGSPKLGITSLPAGGEAGSDLNPIKLVIFLFNFFLLFLEFCNYLYILD